MISGLHHLIAYISGTYLSYDWYRFDCVASGVNFARWLDYASFVSSFFLCLLACEI